MTHPPVTRMDGAFASFPLLPARLPDLHFSVQNRSGKWKRAPAAPSQSEAKPRPEPYSGMFPCFLGGFLSRLFRSMANVVMSFRRVKRGSMISSM